MMIDQSTNPKRFFASRAYLNSEWQTDVLIETNHGLISKLTASSSAQDCELLTGPVLPAISNLHSHAFQYLMAGLAEVSVNSNDSFWSWRDLMYRLVAELAPEDIEIIATQLYIDMLKAGYTQVGEFQYLFNDRNGVAYDNPCELSERLVSAARNTNIGITLLPTLYSYSGFGGQDATAGQKRFLNSTDQYLNIFRLMSDSMLLDKLNNVGHCFHSLRAVSKQQMVEILATIRQATPIHIHIAEQQKEIQDCITWSGQRPVQWLFDNFNVSQDWCLVHATHLDDTEIAAIANSQAVVGLCPTTEANLGDGIFPGTRYTESGGRWGIGSDSHVSLSVKDELRSLEYSQRLNDQQRNRLYDNTTSNVGDHLFQQAHQGGNQALGVDIGLAAGQRADFIVLDDSHPIVGARADSDIINSWVFASNENLVKDVFVAGKQIISNQHHRQEESSNKNFSALMRRVFQ